MKKVISVVLLSLMFSLQVFQLCDESHDACEALANNSQVISPTTFKYSQTKPVDDPDADLPLVVGQALSHGKIIDNRILIALPLASFPQIATINFTSKILMQDRAPPGAYAASTAPPLISLLLASSEVLPGVKTLSRSS